MSGLPHARYGRRRPAILLVALVAFWLAQAMAIAHTSRHVVSDAGGLPGEHSQLCTDCASLLPLLVVTGGGCSASFGAACVALPLLLRSDIRPAQVAAHPPFRSRAPPR